MPPYHPQASSPATRRSMQPAEAVAQGHPLTVALHVPLWLLNATQLPVSVGLVLLDAPAGGGWGTGAGAGGASGAGGPAGGPVGGMPGDPSGGGGAQVRGAVHRTQHSAVRCGNDLAVRCAVGLAPALFATAQPIIASSTVVASFTREARRPPPHARPLL